MGNVCGGTRQGILQLVLSFCAERITKGECDEGCRENQKQKEKNKRMNVIIKMKIKIRSREKRTNENAD
jgi:hypothetical protein